MSADLVFSSAQLHDPNLVFGDDGGTAPSTDAVLSLDATLPRLRGSVLVRTARELSVVGTFPKLRGSVGVNYATNTDRPTVGEVRASFQQAVNTEVGVVPEWQGATTFTSGAQSNYQDAKPLHGAAEMSWQEAARVDTRTPVSFQEAVRRTEGAALRFQEATRVKAFIESMYQAAMRSVVGAEVRFQEAYRDRRNWAAPRFQDAVPTSTQVETFEGPGLPLFAEWDIHYQEARPTPPGIWVKPIVPPEPGGCYTPNPNLVFCGTPNGPYLLFSCECEPGPQPGETIVVPVKRVYMQLNEATLIRVSDSRVIPTYSMSMSLDVDSWTWTFDASVPGIALSDLEPGTAGEPVEVEAQINGAPYRFLVESISRDRSFANSRLRVGGRGKSALLDSPYAPSMTFANSALRSANQLMTDVLTLNGVPLGWDVDWGIEDWNVPAGVFTHTGSYMSALLQIAAAPGAYIQPHPTLQTLYVKPRYPALPFQWNTLTPDYELPSAGVTRESIEWKNLPAYNRVFVTGEAGGMRGDVNLAGTDGLLLAPMVTDPLITDAIAARQRGVAVLSATGRQAPISLRMPIFEETGIIPPGKLVRYVDGGVERLGMSRSVQVDVGLPEIWQTVALETYE